jgi:redox-sensing transcriptional repressor
VRNGLRAGVAGRLSRYLQVVSQAARSGRKRISSREISAYTGINATQVRRDLSSFGKFGKRGVGYDVARLREEIRALLDAGERRALVVVGAGRLGQALASSQLFSEHGLTIAGIFDVDPEKVGLRVGELTVSPRRELAGRVREQDVVAGVIAVPAGAAQGAADDLTEAGVKVLFNYSEALLDVPEEVDVHTLNPAVELLRALSSRSA